ncbi:PREDICTED: olfactory receptor 14A16-like [Gekko japonicus]|uniref:Olfactory receptor n=1 Tax=Gekko japonicus TaxID=146911 RepID=A0ABM1L643_GEKJA|nr:PREDICTED: olfactory receptor 14A16-like [Gekko japonicus]
MSNLSSTSEFLLLELSNVPELQFLHFFVFLAVYLIAVTGNLIIILSVVLDHQLHTPMYFFLVNLAILDLGSVSVAMPKSMANSLLHSRSISYSGCVAQVFFLFFFGGSDFAILMAMSYDRYVAICKPLQYETIMHRGVCMQMAGGAWISGVIYGILHTAGTFAITFCSNMVNQFFCETPQLLKLSCSDLYLVEIGLLILSFVIVLGCFIFMVLTYMEIITTVLRIPSVHGRKKALSTCLPHLTVVSLLVFTGMFAYVRPPGNTSSEMNVICAVIYAILPPLLNPFIYSMRNKEIKTALLKLTDFGHFPQTSSSKILLVKPG